MVLYMEVSHDKYELPICVAGSLDELARMTGRTKSGIACHISHAKQLGYKFCKYVRVEIEEDEDAGK